MLFPNPNNPIQEIDHGLADHQRPFAYRATVRRSTLRRRGGSNYNVGNLNAALGGGFASPGVVVAPVTQTDTKVVIPTIQNFGGLQAVL